jgi:propanol-preferring alcohol dehydrogenase
MRAMVLESARTPLSEKHLERRRLQAGEVRVRVAACAVCRTDLHVVDGELPDPKLPIVPGHEIVGHVVETAPDITQFVIGQRVGIPWLGWTCVVCEFCLRHEENLCPNARFTGYQIDGGYAEETVADARFVFSLPDDYDDREAAPLLCAGLIGWRALKAAGSGDKLGFYGFGAAAHLAVQTATQRGQRVFGLVRPGDERGRSFALGMGAEWAGYSNESPPVALDAAIIFAPVGDLVPQALKAVRPGGRVVCAGIRMSDIPSFPYAVLWKERSVSSAANLTRADAEEFLALAGQAKFCVETVPYPLGDANRALSNLRSGELVGAAVLLP